MPAGSLFAFKLASKIPGAATYLSKNISFPLNPLSGCPKSRCNLVSGTSSATISSLLSGVPLFDVFNKMGVVLGLGSNQLLNFDITKLNKVNLCWRGRLLLLLPPAQWMLHAFRGILTQQHLSSHASCGRLPVGPLTQAYMLQQCCCCSSSVNSKAPCCHDQPDTLEST